MKLRLEVDALEVTSFDAAGQMEVEAVQMTGASGFCNTCVDGGCHWTE